MSNQGFSRFVGLLLGPAATEIGCEECFSELDRYVDLQLGGGDADFAVPGMVAHLEGCPACREDYESLRALAANPTTSAWEDEV